MKSDEPIFKSGSSRILLPVAAKMAFASADVLTHTPGSPTPAGDDHSRT
jgi:hypothetical protein